MRATNATHTRPSLSLDEAGATVWTRGASTRQAAPGTSSPAPAVPHENRHLGVAENSSPRTGCETLSRGATDRIGKSWPRAGVDPASRLTRWNPTPLHHQSPVLFPSQRTVAVGRASCIRRAGTRSPSGRATTIWGGGRHAPKDCVTATLPADLGNRASRARPAAHQGFECTHTRPPREVTQCPGRLERLRSGNGLRAESGVTVWPFAP